ncbi:unnamed protein product [Polarella glacialis]|uniref:Uncharacterized protein n=1 Tax=Polarella glacialis TaxID=89957 RepID=A0A813J4H7_POLGL|nr:unnamed protein product [Polarella glacialis]CAE8665507.1 unnamed protein product [Polarella glacialis]
MSKAMSKQLALAEPASSQSTSDGARKGSITSSQDKPLTAGSQSSIKAGPGKRKMMGGGINNLADLVKQAKKTEDIRVGETMAAKSSDKFLIGLVGATLMILQVVILIVGLTSWIKVENQELVDELKKAGLKV